ncbi:hypothetical protein, partial [Stenotrophomonas maltophilia]|uniref:hypothetical protein n=1 Tax=Stenotrophomonas maltophilia TaxID=40324 RepID=UPI0015DF3517
QHLCPAAQSRRLKRLHGVRFQGARSYGRHWIIESTASKREDILLQDIGLRVWAESMAMKANRATQQDAASDDTPISKGFLVMHETGNC